MATPMRPSSLRAGSSIWLRQSSRPPSVPPDTTRDRSTVPAPVRMDSSVRSGSSGSTVVVICEATLPSTSGWPLPMNTLSVASPSATTDTATLPDSSLISASRWSSRSFGGWPLCWKATRNLFVELGDALRERGDFLRFDAEPAIDLGRHVAHARVVTLEPFGQRTPFGNQHLARRDRCRRRGNFVDRVGEALQRARQAVGRIA